MEGSRHWAEDSKPEEWEKLKLETNKENPSGTETAPEKEKGIEEASKIVQEACGRMCEMLDTLIGYYEEVAKRLGVILDGFSEHERAINDFFDKYPEYRGDWTGFVSWRQLCEYRNSMDSLMGRILARLTEVSRERGEIAGKVQSGIASLPKTKDKAAGQLYEIMDDTVRSIRIAFDQVLEFTQGIGEQGGSKPLTYFLYEAQDQGLHFGGSMSSGALGGHFSEIQGEVEYIERLAQKLDSIRPELKEEALYNHKMDAMLVEKRAAEDHIGALLG